MQLSSAAVICELCGREIVANPAEHYRGHLDHARAYLQLVESRGGNPSWSATAREWIKRCETMLAGIESGTVSVAVPPEGEICRPDAEV
jgi:hypothetical protein